MMEAVRPSETSFYFNETARRYIPEGIARRENLMAHRQETHAVFLLVLFRKRGDGI
jgi:hypothetical protein